MKMTQAPSRPGTAATSPSGTMNALLRPALGGALFALTAACSGDLDTGAARSEGEPEDHGSEVVDLFDSADAPEAAEVIEKATFKDDLTFDGFNVACTADQKDLITEAEARAREILAIALPATADARVNRTSQKAGIFRSSFVPNASTNPDPNRPAPDEWDIAASRVAQKLLNVQRFVASAVHTCHEGNESILRQDGVFRTCDETLASASTNFDGDPESAIRWCEVGLSDDVGPRAVTLLHELIHQDRTADATGGRVFDDDRDGRLYNAQNYGRWLLNNQE